ncbi:MAG: M81 family metallopeptidase [Alphaproteobacteria bacterium]
MAAPQVYVAGLFHEGHSFTSLLTGRDSFVVTAGEALLVQARTSGSILGGGVRALERRGADVVPGLHAAAPPGGAIRDAVYDEFKAQILEDVARERPSAVFLALHGAMLTESLTDPEGDLLGALRAELGPERPLATALDLHAHVTPAMLEAATICLACKDNPHSDYADAGALAADLLVDCLEDRIAPVTAAVWLPLVIGAQLETASGPLQSLHDRRRQALAPSVLDISICNPTAYLDASGAGQCVSVITDGDSGRAERIASELARDFWRRRDAFGSDAPPFRQAIAEALSRGGRERPLVLGDQGDRVLAGAPGDDTQLMRLLHDDWPGHRALVPVTDPGAVRRAMAAGIGSDLDLALGGRCSEGVTPFAARWHVAGLGDGHFVQRGPYLAGEPADLGPTAVLQTANLTVLATSRPGLTQDPNAFESQGLRPRDFDVLVTKSGLHFKLSFADIGDCLVVDTPGSTNYRPGLLPYRRRRPVYPEDEVATPDFSAWLFG